MTAHVAEASENSGRVLVWLDPQSAGVSPALEASARVAAAYGADIETVVVGDYSFSQSGDVPLRAVSTTGNGQAIITSIAEMPDVFGLAVRRARRLADRSAQERKVSARNTGTTGDAIDRLAEMCRQNGPWNIVALTKTSQAGDSSVISDILANVSGATGVIVAGPLHERPSADVVVAIEDAERLPSMLRAAERIAGGKGCIRVLIAAPTRSLHGELEAAARLAIGARAGFVFEGCAPTFGIDGAMDETLRATRAGFVIARFGGTLLAHGRTLARTLALTRAPFLLVR